MTRILIVTTVRLLSDLIQVACKNHSDLEIIGTVNDKSQAFANAGRCDVMLVSYDVPEALTIVQNFGGKTMSPAIVVMGLPNVEPLILRYLEAGAAGCIREQESVQELVQAIRLAAARQVALHADLFAVVLGRVSQLSNQHRESKMPMNERNDKQLTQREREILQLIAQGYANREIAQQLTIELGTAKNHVHNILDKLNVKTRRDAAVYYSLGLV